MIVLAIDPGPTTSGLVQLWCESDVPDVIDALNASNEVVLDQIRNSEAQFVLIETFSDKGWYGRMAPEFRDTLLWSGRFWEAAFSRGIASSEVNLITRWEVLKHLGLAGEKSTDSKVRHYLIQRYSAKSSPLDGVTHHAWQALGLAVMWWDQRRQDERVQLSTTKQENRTW